MRFALLNKDGRLGVQNVICAPKRNKSPSMSALVDISLWRAWRAASVTLKI